MKYLFVINPISGGIDKGDMINIIENEFDDFRIFYTSKNQDIKSLNSKILLYAPTIVVAVGGDGTILLCAEAMLELQCDC